METATNNVDILTLSVTIGVAVVGWLIALWLQRNNVKHQHRVQIKYDIYKQFVSLHKEIQDSISKLGAHASPPFILMSSSMIAFDLKLTKEYKGQWIPWTEQECLFEGEKKWTSFTQELFDLYSDFSNKFLNMLYVVEDWAAALKPLLPTKDILFKETEQLKKNIHEQLGLLQMYSSKHGHDWRTWDQKDVERITQSINEDAMAIGSYLHDFMVLIHNELLASYFGHKRLIRKTLDPKFEVLVKGAIVENVDWAMVKKTEAWKAELISYANEQLKKSSPPNSNISPEYKKFLDSVASGICPNCTTPILVMEAERAEDGFCFRYACGHSWKGISLHETIGIKELFKIKSVREGFGMVRRIVQGWKPSGDPKLNKGVDVYMDVNREKNEYHQIVKEHQTENVLHEEHELLTEHNMKE
ncbi:MAG: hypothetical protein Q8R55_05090 [Candidatus Taylorbacteria bacterium]|nr:hypothetical protein [Candidatus Taylorbacteria bacterium]